MYRVLAIFVALLAIALPARAGPDLDRSIRTAEDLIAGGRVPEARKLLEDARHLAPEDARIPFLLAQCIYNETGGKPDDDRARRMGELLATADELAPKFGGPPFLVGLAAVARKDYARAVWGFRTALERGFRPLVSQQNLANTLYLLGSSRLEERSADTEKTISILAEAAERLVAIKDDLRYLPSARAAFRQLWIRTMLNLASARQSADSLKKAEETLHALIEAEPDNSMARYNIGLLYGQWHRWDEALAAYRKALDLAKDPGFLEPLLQMGWIYTQQGKEQKAEECLKRYLATYDDSWYGHFYLGQHYETTGQLDDAIREYRRCIGISPRSFAATRALYRVLVRAKRPEEAAPVLVQCRKLEAEAKAAGEITPLAKESSKQGMPAPRTAEKPTVPIAPIAAAIPRPPAAPRAGGPSRGTEPAPHTPWWALGLIGAMLLAAAVGFYLQRSRAA